MSVIVSFSGRIGGNCDTISNFISHKEDCIFYMRDISTQPCAHCSYECFSGVCKYRDDGIYSLLEKIINAEKVFFIVPMYCGNPSALFFILNERCQDFFMHNGVDYEGFVEKLYIIGVYGNRVDQPDFERLFAKIYGFSEPKKHILGLERHKYGHKINDFLLDEDEVKERVNRFAYEEVI